MRKKRILVTGGHGFICSYVVERLKQLGYQPVVTVRHYQESDILADSKSMIYYVDMKDKSGMYGAIQHVDGVIHLAGLLGTSENIEHAREMEEVNVFGALNVLDACKNFDIPLVVIGVGNHWMLNTYSISKTTAEHYALMYANEFGTKINVVRALNACGARQKWGKINKITPTFINAVLDGRPIQVYGGKAKCSVMDMIWVGDIANVLIDVLEKTMSGEYKPNHLNGEAFEAGSGYGMPVWDIAEQVVEACRRAGVSIIETPIVEKEMRAGETESSVVVAKLPYHFEYGKNLPTMKKFDEVLDETVKYYIQIKNE